MRSTCTSSPIITIISAALALASLGISLNGYAEINTPPQITNLLALVRGLPEGEWKQLSLNSYQEVWSPEEFSANIKGDPGSIIRAWSSFAWDSNRGNLILYGGGHANYWGNDVYFWEGETRKWERASLPSDVINIEGANYTAIDGVFAAPVSAHTYDNNLFLPNIDRFITFGGAKFDASGPYTVELPSGGYRSTGPYLFDPSKADPFKVGGTTGSHVQLNGPHPEIIGGEMWQNRDMFGNQADNPDLSNIGSFVEGSTAYHSKNGVDYVYTNPSSGRGLFRYSITDVNDPTSDVWEKVGKWTAATFGQSVAAFDPESNIFVRSASAGNNFTYWDLDNEGPGNPNILFSASDTANEFAFNRDYGLDFDQVRKQFTMWGGGGTVWTMKTPEVLDANDWLVEKQPINFTYPIPDTDVGTGVLGKWKYIAQLDAFIALQDSIEGNIWLYKPVNWSDPIGANANKVPDIELLSPQEGNVYAFGQDIPFTVLTSDPDDSVQKVDYIVNGNSIHTSNTAPFSFSSHQLTIGDYEVIAKAYDETGAYRLSRAIHIEVDAFGALTASVQDGVNGYAGTSDAYMDHFHKNLNTGSETTLKEGAKDAPLIHFAIFQSQGGPIPDNAQIGSARVRLYKHSPYNYTYALHPLLNSWHEDEVNWFQRRSGINWATAGALAPEQDIATQPDAVASVGWSPSWLEFDLTSVIQAIGKQEKTNFGWRLVPVSGNNNRKAFRSREYLDDPLLRPSIEITYIVPNQTPVVNLTSPQNDDSFIIGDSILITADASDTDGTVSSVSFYADGEIIGSDSEAPYAIDWTNATVGSHTLSVLAYDNDNAESAPTTITIAVENDNGNSPQILVLQDGLNGYAGTADTYLKATHKNSSLGSAQSLFSTKNIRTPMLHFAIFQSEGGPLANATNIESAYLRLYKYSPYNYHYALHPILTPWQEDQATWNESSPGIPWVIPGAQSLDNDIAIQADATGDVAWSPGWIEFDVSDAIQSFSNQQRDNYGWKLVSISGNGNNKQFYSRDYVGDPSLRPMLEIHYSNGNQVPNISFLSPQSGNVFSLGDNVLLVVDANDADGSINLVEFYSDDILIGSATSAPFSLDWTDATSGTHNISAIAYDNSGATNTTSLSITVLTGALQQTVVLQDGLNGYQGTADTYLKSTHKNVNLGAVESLFETIDRRIPLFHFAIFQAEGGPIPDTASIQSAQFRIYKHSPYNYNYALHPVLKFWLEDQATWNESLSGTPWSTPGALALNSDIAEQADAQASIGWNPGWLEFDVTNAVQSVATQQRNNYGWSLIPVSGNGNNKQFYSRDYTGDITLRPQLEVTYSIE